jgi:hypothetical protein
MFSGSLIANAPGSLGEKILIFNDNFALNEQAYLSDLPNKYEWSINPFMRPKDGNIYEFRVLDDGLHVVRWARDHH